MSAARMLSHSACLACSTSSSGNSPTSSSTGACQIDASRPTTPRAISSPPPNAESDTKSPHSTMISRSPKKFTNPSTTAPYSSSQRRLSNAFDGYAEVCLLSTESNSMSHGVVSGEMSSTRVKNKLLRLNLCVSTARSVPRSPIVSLVICIKGYITLLLLLISFYNKNAYFSIPLAQINKIKDVFYQIITGHTPVIFNITCIC